MSDPRHTIEIVIRPDGTVESTLTGVEGTGCKGILDRLARRSGIKVLSDSPTRDWSKDDVQRVVRKLTT